MSNHQMHLGHSTGGHDSMVIGANATHALPEFALSETVSAWILVVVSGTLASISVPSNLLVLFAFARQPKLRTYANYFIINLCVSDLFVSALTMPLTLAENYLKLAGSGWPFGYAACHVVKTIQHVFFSISILTVLLICLDRYQAIVHPLFHLQNRNGRSAVIKIFLAWTVACSVWLLFILLWGLVRGEESLPEGFCTAMYNTNHYSTGVAIALLMWIPYPTILIMYFRVYRKIRAAGGGRAQVKLPKQRRGSVNTTSTIDGIDNRATDIITVECSGHSVHLDITFGANTPSSVGTDHEIMEVHDLSKHPSDRAGAYDGETPILNPPSPLAPSRPTILSDKTDVDRTEIDKTDVSGLRRTCNARAVSCRKATLTLTLVVASYAVCWLPYGIIVPIVSICSMHPDAFPPLPEYFNAAVIAFSLCQSALNPMCYAAAQPAIRHTIRRILTCRT